MNIQSTVVGTTLPDTSIALMNAGKNESSSAYQQLIPSTMEMRGDYQKLNKLGNVKQGADEREGLRSLPGEVILDDYECT